MKQPREDPYYREEYYNSWITKENNKNMAEQVRGTIQYVPEPRTFKNSKYYSIKLNDIYYSVGSKQPPEAGTLVEFEAEKNDKGYWNVTKAGLTVVKAEAPSQSVATRAVAAAAVSPMSKDDYWRRKEERDLAKEDEWIAKDKRIELQSCRNSAIELVKLLITPIQTAEGPVAIVKLPGKAKQVEFVEKLVDEYTSKFVSENNKKNEEIPNAEVPVEGPVESVPQSDDGETWSV
jgi:hypothetical protein